MNIERFIYPFQFITVEGEFSVILGAGEYKAELFLMREDEGFIGNGYDWSSLAAVFLMEKMPQLEDVINFDSEAEMFCCVSSDEEALRAFIVEFKEACEDDVLICDLFSRAQLD